MIRVIRDRITEIVRAWNLDLQSLAGSKEIIAIHFGAQKVEDGYELYLSGHTWYDVADLWLFDKQWSPKSNYISLGKESLEFDRLRILEEYENVLKSEITNKKDFYKDLIVVVALVDGAFERLK